MSDRAKEIAIVFDGPPGPDSESGRFVEVEVDGAGVSLGNWWREEIHRRSRWELRFTAADVERILGPPTGTELADALLARFADGCPDYGSAGCMCGSHGTPFANCPVVAHRAIYVAEAAQAAARALEREAAE